MSVVGLDIGTSGCKCTIFEENGAITSYAYKNYPLIIEDNGIMELDPKKVWQAVLYVVKKAVSEHMGSKINALCITSFGEAGVLIDKEGEVLHNSMLYADPRGEKQCAQLIDKLSRWEVTKRSGHNPTAMYSAPKLMWLAQNKPDVFKKSYKFLQYSGYILYKLSGEIKEDWSLSSRTLMFNVVEKRWDETLLNAAELAENIFPEPIKAGTVAGILSLRMTDETGLPKDTIIILGGQDQISAAIGGGATKAGMAVNGMGTVDCITPIFDKPMINESMQKYSYGCIPYLLDDHYVTYAFNYAGGGLMNWYKENFGHKSYEEMEKSAPKEPTDILVLPHIMGAATPYMDTKAKGAIVGLTVDTDTSTLYKAMMEGASFEAKINIDSLKKAGINIDRLTVCGGGSRSPMWLQIKADIFNMPIDVLEVKEAGTLGAAIMAGAASNAYKDIGEGVKRLVKVKDIIYPDDKNHLRYMEIYEKYKRMYESIRYINGREKIDE